MNIKIYADGADINEMKRMYRYGDVSGFTTNPSLMKKAGVQNYKKFAFEILRAIPDMPISFEVFADSLADMREEALEIASWGKNVFVKIPITNTKQESTIPLINELSKANIQLNVTAIFTEKQVEETVDAFVLGTTNIVSVFAGRIADTGKDPIPYMKKAKEICMTKSGTMLLWASPREVLNIVQAEEIGCDIITCTPEIIQKMKDFDKNLEQYSLETVQMFFKDAQELEYKIIE